MALIQGLNAFVDLEDSTVGDGKKRLATQSFLASHGAVIFGILEFIGQSSFVHLVGGFRIEDGQIGHSAGFQGADFVGKFAELGHMFGWVDRRQMIDVMPGIAMMVHQFGIELQTVLDIAGARASE